MAHEILFNRTEFDSREKYLKEIPSTAVTDCKSLYDAMMSKTVPAFSNIAADASPMNQHSPGSWRTPSRATSQPIITHLLAVTVKTQLQLYRASYWNEANYPTTNGICVWSRGASLCR